MKTNLVKFKSRDGFCLNGALFEPETNTDKIIIHVHGSAGDFYSNMFILPIAKKLCESGTAFLTFNNKGAHFVDEVFGKINGKKENKICGFMHDTLNDALFDIEGAIDFALKHNYKNINLSGHSLGTQKILHYALNRKFNGKIILIAPFDTQKTAVTAGMIKEAAKGSAFIGGFFGNHKVSLKSFNDIWAAGSNGDIFNLREFILNKKLQKLKNRVFVILGEQDVCYKSLNIKEVMQYFADSFKITTIQVVKGADHLFSASEKYSKELADIMAGFALQ